jgi:hypothetical protein
MDLMYDKMEKIHRYNREVIVTEKIDGTNASVFIDELGEPHAGSKTRWISVKDDNYGFARWVEEHKRELRGLGPGLHRGEWWGNGIQRTYNMKRGKRFFSLFNTSRWNNGNVPSCCRVVPVLWKGFMRDFDQDRILEELVLYGSAVAPGFMRPEGIVVFHTQANTFFKITLEHDGTGKWDK